MKDLGIPLKQLKGLWKSIIVKVVKFFASIKLPNPFAFPPGHRIMRLIQIYA